MGFFFKDGTLPVRLPNYSHMTVYTNKGNRGRRYLLTSWNLEAEVVLGFPHADKSSFNKLILPDEPNLKDPTTILDRSVKYVVHTALNCWNRFDNTYQSKDCIEGSLFGLIGFWLERVKMKNNKTWVQGNYNRSSNLI